MRTLYEFTRNYSEMTVGKWNIRRDGAMLAFRTDENLAFGVGIDSNGDFYRFRNMEYHEFSDDRWDVVDNSQASNILKRYFLTSLFPQTIAFDNLGRKYNLNDQLFTVARKPYSTDHSTFILKDNADNSYIELMSDGIWNENALLKEDPNEPKVGNVCMFWNDNRSDMIIGKLGGVSVGRKRKIAIESTSTAWFGNYEKVTNPEIIKLFSNA